MRSKSLQIYPLHMNEYKDAEERKAQVVDLRDSEDNNGEEELDNKQ